MPGDGPGRDGVDPRFARCRTRLRGADADGAAAPRDAPPAPERDRGGDRAPGPRLLVVHARMARSRAARGATSTSRSTSTRTYAYLKKVLQVLTFLRGPNRWVLKSPQHLEQIPALLATFPDATFAVTHRDPVSVIQSAITMLAYGDRMRRTAIEPEALAAYWIDRVDRLLHACVRDRDLLPADRSVDVLFHEFMADDVGTVERIYGRNGLELTADARAAARRVHGRQPARPARPRRVRPPGRLRRRPGRGPRPLRLLLRPVPRRRGGRMTDTLRTGRGRLRRDRATGTSTRSTAPASRSP